MKVIQPYSDDVLAYNKDTGKYELTLTYVKEKLGNSFVDDGILQKRIQKNSRKIYNVIFARIYNANGKVVSFMLERTEEGRQYLHDLLLEQMEADLESGFNDLSSTPAVNVSNGQVLDRNQLYANQISVDTEQILERSEQYFGFNLLYRSLFPSYLYLFVAQYNK